MDPNVPVVNVLDLANAAESGAVWSLPHGGDLDANIIRLPAGDAIDEHVNDEVDVIIAVWNGEGDLTVDGGSFALHPGVVVSIPRGRRRAVYAGAMDLIYLSVHRRRGPMRIRPAGTR